MQIYLVYAFVEHTGPIDNFHMTPPLDTAKHEARSAFLGYPASSLETLVGQPLPNNFTFVKQGIQTSIAIAPLLAF